jgi:hypothetical protein
MSRLSICKGRPPRSLRLIWLIYTLLINKLRSHEFGFAIDAKPNETYHSFRRLSRSAFTSPEGLGFWI